MKKIPDICLNNGIEIPVLGMGLYDVNSLDDMKRVVDYAIGVGYRLFDTAKSYGNEDILGKALKNAQVDRDELFITSKVSREDVRFSRTREVFLSSLKVLGCDYLDLYLIHWPVQGYEKAWLDMVELYEQGLIRAIGVSNCWPEHLERLFHSTGIKPMVNQMEFHPRKQQPQTLEYCRNNNILLEAYGPFMQGQLLNDPILAKIAEKYQCNAAQVILRWILDCRVAVIAKSATPSRIKENLSCFEIVLAYEDTETINGLNINKGIRPDPDAFL